MENLKVIKPAPADIADEAKPAPADIADEAKTAPENEPPQKKRSAFRRLVGSVLRSAWTWLILLFPAALLLRAAASGIEGFADFWCGYIYRPVSVFWSFVSGIVPFSVGEILLILLPFAALAYIIAVIVAIVRSKGQRVKKLVKGIVRPIAAASLVFFVYITNCGINYYCSDVLTLSGMKLRETSAQELYEVCVYLADQASECRSRLSENENGVAVIDISAAKYKTRDAVNSLHARYGYIPDGYSIPKGVMLSRAMSYLDVTGIYSPFTFEANVNTDMRNFTVPFTMCHELSHVRGFMHEQDANFIAYLACICSGDYELMYSGYAEAVRYVSKYLRLSDGKLYNDFLTHLSDGVFRDYEDNSQYWKQFETPIAEAASSVNDSYLKFNAQPEGIMSYNRITELIIAHYFTDIKGAAE